MLGDLSQYAVHKGRVEVYAPTNIALCKYWGKRDQELNLPVTSSLSISLDNKGAITKLSMATVAQDVYLLNGEIVAASSSFYRRLKSYLDLFRPHTQFYFNV